MVALSPLSLRAQTNVGPAGNRYLLVLQTSHSMDRRGDGTLKAIQQLLMSGIGGQLQFGDTLGIWTYNN